MAKQPADRLFKWLGFSLQGDLGPLTTWTNHNNKLVIVPRAPPLNPPSPEQENLRAFFKTTAQAWHALTPEQRAAWITLARKANLRITGYNLYLWYLWSNDQPTIETLERQTGITVL